MSDTTWTDNRTIDAYKLRTTCIDAQQVRELERSHRRLLEALKKAKTCQLNTDVRDLINAAIKQAIC